MRMLGKVRPAWCPRCRARPGPDCPDSGKTTRQVKRAEKRSWQQEERPHLLQMRHRQHPGEPQSRHPD